MEKINLIKTGLSNYREIWELQKKLFSEVTEERNKHYFIFAEHKPVITFGKAGNLNNLVSQPDSLSSQGIEVLKIDRGGDVTFHGPGQIVGYPILNLLKFKKDVHWYLRTLEQVIIQTLLEFEFSANRIEGLTGVWVENKKICAIGVKITRWVTMHGFALNVSTDLNYFSHIIPCGISDKGVTSISELKGNTIIKKDVVTKLMTKFEEIFKAKFIY